MRPIVLGLFMGLFISGLGPSAQAASELCVEGPTTITINHLLGDAPPAGTELIISNCGEATSVLNWSSSLSGTAAPLVILSPSSGAIQPGQGQTGVEPSHIGTSAPTVHPSHGLQRVWLDLNLPGLASGFFSGQLTIRNDDTPSETVVINLNLNITSINFVPGDTLVGSISPANDTDAAAFYGLKGMSLRLTVRKSTEVSRLRITVLDTSAAALKSFTFKTNQTRRKRFTLDDHGLFLLRFESADGSTGAYRVETDRSLPSNATPRSLNKLKVKPVEGETFGMVTVKLAGLPGAQLNANILPLAPLNLGDLSFAFKTPSGQTFDTTNFDSSSQTGFHLVRLPLAEAGIFKLEIIVDRPLPGDRITVPIWPFQPKGNSEIDLDE